MSRRLSSTHRPRVHQPSADNPYQATTLTLPLSNNSVAHTSLQYEKVNYYTKCGHNNYDTGLEEESFTDNSYCDHNYEQISQNHCKKNNKAGSCMFSDDSGSTRLPYYEYDEISDKRLSRNNFSDRSSSRKGRPFGADKLNASIRKDSRRIYPNGDYHFERNCQETTQRYIIDTTAMQPILPIRVPISRLSDRPQSSLSSGVGSVVVDGCGGRCQTFENVCYYFLQVAFAMGILIGISLCIAGAVLRKSAARNLQVLVYIGVLLSLVSALLLSIQCNARNNARKRKRALRNAKRTPIALEVLNARGVPVHQPLITATNQRYPMVNHAPR